MNDLEVIKTETKFCLYCFKVHEVKTVKFIDHIRDDSGEVDIPFEVVCEYCENTDEYWENEEMILKNVESMRNALFNYRKNLIEASE